ncbi:MAG TPA: SLC13 family permease [Spirochaetia bacterium]|nr:SLC13 family permease [Spirochaetia bacterium]
MSGILAQAVSPPALAVLVLLLTVVLLAGNKVRPQVVAVLALGLVGALNLVSYQTLFQGFANPAVILIASMMILGEALQRTGVTARVGRWVASHAGGGEAKTSGLLMLAAAVPSALISDVGVITIFIRMIEGMRSRLGIPPSRLLLPVAYGASLGGLLTLLGSSGNILANQLLIHAGSPGLSLFAMTPLAMILVVVGVVYTVLLGNKLLPARSEEEGKEHLYGLRQYRGELDVLPNFPGRGQALKNLALPVKLGIRVISIRHSDGSIVDHPDADTMIGAGDRLWVQGAVTDLLGIHENSEYPGLRLLEEDGFRGVGEGHTEALVTPKSPLRGHTLAELNFRQRYQTSVVAVSRLGETATPAQMASMRFRVGDTLLLRGPEKGLASLAHSGVLLLQQEVDYHPPRSKQAWLAEVTMLAVLLTGATGLLPTAVAAILGVAMVVITGCLTPEEAQKSLELRILVLIAGMLTLGAALEGTGVVSSVAQAVLRVVGDSNPVILLAAVYLLAAILTQVFSNAVTVVLVTPLAIQAAMVMHFNPTPLVVAVIIAVSATPVTPFGNQTNLLVMGPGRYRMGDYLRVGAPLSLLNMLISLTLIPVFWSFKG